jgi:hypothetical protein
VFRVESEHQLCRDFQLFYGPNHSLYNRYQPQEDHRIQHLDERCQLRFVFRAQEHSSLPSAFFAADLRINAPCSPAALSTSTSSASALTSLSNLFPSDNLEQQLQQTPPFGLHEKTIQSFFDQILPLSSFELK